MSELAPGDLCVIIGEGFCDCHRYLIGRTVVLLRESTAGRWKGWPTAPFWACGGVEWGLLISHMNLRKIPPDEMIDARTHMEPLEIEPQEVE